MSTGIPVVDYGGDALGWAAADARIATEAAAFVAQPGPERVGANGCA